MTHYRNSGRKKTPIVGGKKVCGKCEVNKEIEEYSTPNKPWCKNCVKIYNRKYNRKYAKEVAAQKAEYQKQNRSQINAHRRKRWAEDEEFKINVTLRNRINECIKKYNHNKKDTFRQELGCSVSEFIKHLESQFDSKMNWQNHGTYWEIDHIIPLSKGGSFHFTNTQPLTWVENRSKSNK